MNQILFLTVLLAIVPLRAANGNTQEFLDHLLVVEEMLTDKPVYQEMKRLSELNPRRADFLASFWTARALSERRRAFDDTGALFEKMNDARFRRLHNDPDGKKADSYLSEGDNMIFITDYYSQVGELHDLLRLNLKKAESEHRTKK